MEARLTAQRSQTRCYRCGDETITGICHHRSCGRAVCTQHASGRSRAGRFGVTTGKPTSVEFSGLGLQETRCGEDAVHCEHHAHIVWRPPGKLAAVGVLLLAVGAFLLLGGVVVGLVLVVTGGVVVVAWEVLRRRRAAERLRWRPDAPLVPRLEHLSVHETLCGHIVLDADGRYTSTVTAAEGTLTVAARFGSPERDMLERYHNKYRPQGGDPVTFHAGFVVPRGAVGIELEDTTLAARPGSMVFPLTGKVDASSYLSMRSDRASERWPQQVPYRLRTPASIDTVPLWLIPSLVPERQRHALELELHWAELKLEGTNPAVSRIETLSLDVPTDWGEIQNTVPIARVSSPEWMDDRAVRTVTWRQLVISEKAQAARRQIFYLHAERAIDSAVIIRGRLELTARGSLSGIRSLSTYYPVGTFRRGGKPAEIETRISIEFELSLAGLRYQDIHILPGTDQEADQGRSGTSEFPGVIPDHETLIALTGALSKESFYVKRVVENPPRTGGRANVIRRYWDITGRRYDGVYPVDFHLTVTGEEQHQGGIRAQSGTTQTELTVTGRFASPEMREQIDNVWEQLCTLVADTLKPRSGTPPAAPGTSR